MYDGDNVIEALDQNGNVLGRTTQGLGIDEPLVGQSGTTTAYYEADGLGSVTSLTTTAGAVTATYSYDSFGVSTGTTGTASTLNLWVNRTNQFTEPRVLLQHNWEPARLAARHSATGRAALARLAPSIVRSSTGCHERFSPARSADPHR